MDHAPLGFQKENILYVQLNDDNRSTFNAAKNRLLESPMIENVTSASHLPMAITGGYYQKWGSEEASASYLCETRVSFDYLSTLNIKLVDGRFYSREFPSDLSEALNPNGPFRYNFVEDFAFPQERTAEIAQKLFILTGSLVLFISFVTIGYQAMKVATANPVAALKYE